MPTVVMPYLAQRRLKNGNSTVALPTLVQRRQADADLQPTITTFYRRWFDVTLQTGDSCLISVICVYLFIVVSNAYCVVFCLVCLHLVYPMCPVSLDYPFLIADSVFSGTFT